MGAVLGAFSWTLVKPRVRFTQGMILAVAINWAAWAAFLVFTPPLEEAEFDAIARQRTARDAGEFNFITDQPTVMAARWFGGFRSMPVTERALFLMAGFPVLMAEQYVMPARYLGSPPTRGESQVMAAIGFVASTAFWASFSGAMGWLRRQRSAATAFPWGAALFTSTVGLLSLLLAGFAVFIRMIDTSGAVVNGHIVGGLSDTLVLLLFATVCGGYGLYCVLRFRHEFAAWRGHR